MHCALTAVMPAILGALYCLAPAVGADKADAPAVKSLDTVVITAKRMPETVPDELVKQRVETALHDDPFFYDGHVAVTVKNGVVHLQGIVFDAADIRDARRIIRRKVAGVKRVINELEICSCDGGGGGG
jgi:osmotically-inducible protein OsmY